MIEIAFQAYDYLIFLMKGEGILVATKPASFDDNFPAVFVATEPRNLEMKEGSLHHRILLWCQTVASTAF